MTKRANGEGTVFQRKDGRWQGQKTVPALGLAKPYRRTVYGKTQREVLAKLKETDRQVQQGVNVTLRPRTLAQYGVLWFGSTKRIEVERGHNQASTVSNYRDIWNVHIAPDIGHVLLDDLTPALLREWLAAKTKQVSSRTGRPLSARTQTLIYAVLRAALNDAVRDEVIPSNQLLKVKPPRGASKKAVPLTDTQITDLFRELEGHRLFTLALLMLTTGARPGEALAAAYSDIDLDAGTWHISRSLTRTTAPGDGRRTMLTFKTTKNPVSEATITLPAIAVMELRRHKSRQAEARLASKVWSDPDLVFTTSIGTPLEPRNVLREFKRVALSAGIDRNVRVHDLRHAAASALLDEDIDITVTSKLLRHARLATTSDIYSHLLKKGRDKAAAAMDQRFGRLVR